MDREILHIDVNNAFLSWTAVYMLKKGYGKDIRNIPAIIGGDETKRSGIVLAKSNIAKQFGIVTAETIYNAKRKCENLEIYPANYKVYKYYSDKLYSLLLQYTDKIEKFSVDECFLDMTEYLLNDTILHKAEEIKDRVKNELGFTVNIGISNNKLLAKMASDFEKPNKIHTLYQNEIKEKMWNLPISELFMTGKRTVPKLFDMGIRTIGDLAQIDLKVISKRFGKNGKQMWEYANGIDNSQVEWETKPPKSISQSITLPKDASNIEELNKILFDIVDNVSYRLRKNNLKAKTINVQLRNNNFCDYSHQKRLDISTSNTKIIYSIAKQLLKELYNGDMIRLIGLKLDKLEDNKNIQISLFEGKENEKQNSIDATIDLLHNKYGIKIIKRGTNL